MPRDKTQNLTKAFNLIPPEEARVIQSKGGKASVEARKKRKTFKEELIALLEATQKDGESVNAQVSIALIAKALDGDVKAFEVIRDTIGEKPVDKQEIKTIDTDWFIDEETK